LCDEVLKAKKNLKGDAYLSSRSTFWPSSVENFVRQTHHELCLKNLIVGDIGPL
jgi:hypothetical protein